MKVTFYSNFLTHHQLPFCMEMVSKYGNDFKFVATIKITEERLKLGFKNLDDKYDFVVKAYESKEEYDKALKLAVESDIVIMGSTSDKYIGERLKQDKLTFRYRARVFSNGIMTIFDKEKMKLLYERHIKYRKNKNLYMLCANAYGANDFYKLGLYKNKIYKWGYFPETKEYNLEQLIKNKEKSKPINIVWVARFIKWKHPEKMIKLAKKLVKDGLEFKITMIGTGVMYEKIKEEIHKNNLENYVELTGAVESDKVRDYMEKANIFILTSGKQEGWGAVLNEAMNSACAVITDINVGAAPFLINDSENGLLYKNFEELYMYTKNLIEDNKLRKKLYENAYKTILETWNSKNATNNLINLFESIKDGQEYKIKDGPASKATPIKI